MSSSFPVKTVRRILYSQGKFPKMLKSLIFTKIILITLTWFQFPLEVVGAPQKVTVYELPDAEGDAMTLTKKYPDITEMTDLRDILHASGTICGIGAWAFHDLPHFHDEWYGYGGGMNNRTHTCQNLDNFYLGLTQSIRYMGPDDFDTPAIGFYEGGYYDESGREAVVTGEGGNNFGFVPRTGFLFGNSSWTLFTGNNFEGNSTCFVPHWDRVSIFTGKMYFGASFTAHSAVLGCDPLEVEDNIKSFRTRHGTGK